MDEQKKELTVDLLEKELQREQQKQRRRKRRRIVLLVLLILIVLAFAFGLLGAQLLLISGDSMSGTLCDGDLALGLKLPRYRDGNVVCFFYEDGLLVKRLIAQGGEWVEFDENGYVFVNGARLREPYVTELAYGTCDVEFPLTVPGGTCFLLGDNRAVSIDSRSTGLGFVDAEAIAGRMLLRIWPLSRFGLIR